jgi:hypothetical protein
MQALMNSSHFTRLLGINKIHFLASTYEQPVRAKRKKVKSGNAKKEDFFGQIQLASPATFGTIIKLGSIFSLGGNFWPLGPRPVFLGRPDTTCSASPEENAFVLICRRRRFAIIGSWGILTDSRVIVLVNVTFFGGNDEGQSFDDLLAGAGCGWGRFRGGGEEAFGGCAGASV